MQKKAAKLFVLPILFLISCSGSNNNNNNNNDNPSSFIDDPLNLKTGQCFNDFSDLYKQYGDGAADATFVEVVSCSTPHNFEVTAVYSSVPLSYRNSADPVNDLCVDESVNLLRLVFPNKTGNDFYQIALEFDKKFKTQMFGVYDLYGEIDIDQTIICSVTSSYTLAKTNLTESIRELN